MKKYSEWSKLFVPFLVINASSDMVCLMISLDLTKSSEVRKVGDQSNSKGSPQKLIKWLMSK